MWKGTVWVDADSCPREIRDFLQSTSCKRRIKVRFVANRPLDIPESEYVATVSVPEGPDEADRFIEVSAQAGIDIVVTRDIPLAARLLERSVCVINDRGGEFDAQTIGARLAERDLKADLRTIGLLPDKKRSFGPRERKDFVNAFDRVVTRLSRDSG